MSLLSCLTTLSLALPSTAIDARATGSAERRAQLLEAGDAEAPRARAAEVLRAALAESRRGDDADSGSATLIRGARAASELLSGSSTASTLERHVREARWRALLDPGDARTTLARQLARVAGDLEFEPTVEAELPAGFPAPTPVGVLELKRYPAYRMARADTSDGRAFWRLFQHINEREIAMTAPVEMTWDGAREASMAFLYSTPELGETGRDGALEVVDIAPATVLSIGCRGATTPEALAAARDALERWAESRGLALSGEPRTMSYNSPMVPAERRYFEVQIPVRTEKPAALVIDFSNPSEAARWQAIDDVVMGGRSSSRFESKGEASAFTGTVSLENNGGFASVRAPLRADLDGASELVLRFRGDGKAYKLRLRTTGAFDGVNYECRFETKAGVWAERSFAASDFAPVWRGRPVRGAPALDFAAARSIGLMISDEQQGSFRLELASLRKR